MLVQREDSFVSSVSESHQSRQRLIDVITLDQVIPHFQPIVELMGGNILGYEGLIRGPEDSDLHMPDVLFRRAEQCDLTKPLEIACRFATTMRFGAFGLPSHLFLNVSPRALLAGEFNPQAARDGFVSAGVDPCKVVLEITEETNTVDYGAIRLVVDLCRKAGFSIAIDDLGTGFANLRLWDELLPDFVKIDRHFINGLHRQPMKEEFVRSIHRMAMSSGARVIAEGIETPSELEVILDVGIELGQGFLLGRPLSAPAIAIPAAILQQIALRRRRGKSFGGCASDLAIQRTALPSGTPLSLAIAAFKQDPGCLALPVIGEDGTLVGLVRRVALLEYCSEHPTTWSADSITAVIDAHAVCVDADEPLAMVTHRLSVRAAAPVGEGFVIMKDGRFLGLGRLQDLMRAVGEQQSTAERYANPLTQLPGNVPISDAIQSRLDRGEEFVVVRLDLDNIQSFNERFGCSRGDQLLVLMADVLKQACQFPGDLVGHLGGDDFVLVLDVKQWAVQIQSIQRQFAVRCSTLQAVTGIGDGRFNFALRDDAPRVSSLIRLSVGVAITGPGHCKYFHEVEARAVAAQTAAKLRPDAILVDDARIAPDGEVTAPLALVVPLSSSSRLVSA